MLLGALVDVVAGEGDTGTHRADAVGALLAGLGTATPAPAVAETDAADDAAGDFEVMYVLRADAARAAALRETLARTGHSVAVVGAADATGAGVWQVHVHTDAPLTALAEPAVMDQVCVRYLRPLLTGLPPRPSHGHAPEASAAPGPASPQAPDAPGVTTGVVACTRAPGLLEPLARTGAVVVLDPPADPAGLLRAAADTGAARVLVLPCDEASAATARAAPGRADGRAAPHLGGRQEITVAATRNELHVLAAAVEVSGPGTPAAGGLLPALAEQAARRVRTVELDADAAPAALLADELGPADELVTALLGAGADDEVAEQLREAVAQVAPQVEVVVVRGGQSRPGRAGGGGVSERVVRGSRHVPAVAGDRRGRLSTPLTKAVGPKTAEALEKLGPRTTGDLLRYYPRRYGDRGKLTDLAHLRLDEHVTVIARVATNSGVRPMRNRNGAILNVTITDGRAELQLTFFGKRAGPLQGHEKRLRPGTTGMFTGTVSAYRGSRQLTHPDYETFEDRRRRVRGGAEDRLAGADLPGQRRHRQLADRDRRAHRARGAAGGRRARAAARRLPRDPPPGRRAAGAAAGSTSRTAPPRSPAPTCGCATRRRSCCRRRSPSAAPPCWPSPPPPARPAPEASATPSRPACPSRSPPASARSATSSRPSSPAPCPCSGCCRARWGPARPSSRCAPCSRWSTPAGRPRCWPRPRSSPSSTCAPSPRCSARWREAGMLGGAEEATRVTLLTGSLGATARRKALAAAASGEAGIVIGTHALLSENVQFADLGLVVIDEQHRFGVEQRDALRAKADGTPHLLVMTATPIPRTVAMTSFGDLETSTLSELPAGRAGVETVVVPSVQARVDPAGVAAHPRGGRRRRPRLRRVPADQRHRGRAGHRGRRPPRRPARHRRPGRRPAPSPAPPRHPPARAGGGGGGRRAAAPGAGARGDRPSGRCTAG